MEKVINIGHGEYGQVFCKIKYTDGRLSISGVEGPKKNGDCRGSCGQIRDHIEITEFAPGWNTELLTKFVTVWEAWHLNDMRAGTSAQEAALKNMPKSSNHYTDACAFLEKRGLLVDDGYRYGSEWLREEVPAEILEFLAALPETTITPAWV